LCGKEEFAWHGKIAGFRGDDLERGWYQNRTPFSPSLFKPRHHPQLIGVDQQTLIQWFNHVVLEVL
jgi:hypothetical protein